jgi:hypothetical protein
MMSKNAAELTLPAVASRIYTNCKKCAAERYHIVLAHTTATSAKVECEICHSKKAFKLPSNKPKKVGGIAAVKKAQAVENRKSAHSKEFHDLVATANGDSKNYNMKLNYSMNQKITHPKFGVGIIRASLDNKIEVVFEDEVRMLVHNRV